MTNKELVTKLRDETYKEVMSLLKATKRCALVRPCGFGKTVMATRICQSYKKVLFLYPSECVKNTLLYRYNESTNNIEFMTYATLAKKTEKDFIGMDYDLIFADEVHRAGAPKTSLAFRKLIKILNCHVVGSSATIERRDGFDVVQEFFNGITTSPYTLQDAISDGIVPKPYYVFCSWDIKADIKNMLKEKEQILVNEEARRKFRKGINSNQLIQNANLHGMDKVIRNAFDKHLKDTSYMRFIMYFTTIEGIRTNVDMVVAWFKKAYPKHTVRQLEVHSEAKNNAQYLEISRIRKNTIDLIFTCDMLNEGYHVENLTGIFMCRNTVSSKIYCQQIGRVLSFDNAESKKFVFDVVDNLHRRSVFDFKERDDIEIEDDLIKTADIECAKENGDVNPVKTERKSVSNANKEEIEKNETEGVKESEYDPYWYRNANHIEKTDVDAIGNEAQYRDFINKQFEPIDELLVSAMKKYKEFEGKDHKSYAEIRQDKLDWQIANAVCRMYGVTIKAFLTKMGVYEGENADKEK